MGIYSKKVDRRSRKAMAEFISGHFRYNTMNSWNCSTSWANCIKVHHLDLPKDIEDKAWDYVCGDDSIFWDIYYPMVKEDFESKYKGIALGVNGRSGGYIVCYERADNGSVYPGRSIDEDYADLDYCMDSEEVSIRSLKELTDFLCDFDKFCDDLREEFIYFLQQYEEVEEEYTVVKTQKVWREIENA